MLTTDDMQRLLAFKRRYVAEMLGFHFLPDTFERLRFLAWLRARGMVES